jgi:hypothetical protein
MLRLGFNATLSSEHRGYLISMTVCEYSLVELIHADPVPVQAILFLAPLAFDETLEEDPRVNRLVCWFSIIVGFYVLIVGYDIGGQFESMAGDLCQQIALRGKSHTFFQQGKKDMFL